MCCATKHRCAFTGQAACYDRPATVSACRCSVTASRTCGAFAATVCHAALSSALQALPQRIGELHACPSVSIAVTSRIQPVSMHMLYCRTLNAGSSAGLLRLHVGAQAEPLQPDSADRLMRLRGCTALLLRLLGADAVFRARPVAGELRDTEMPAA